MKILILPPSPRTHTHTHTYTHAHTSRKYLFDEKFGTLLQFSVALLASDIQQGTQNRNKLHAEVDFYLFGEDYHTDCINIVVPQYAS